MHLSLIGFNDRFDSRRCCLYFVSFGRGCETLPPQWDPASATQIQWAGELGAFHLRFTSADRPAHNPYKNRYIVRRVGAPRLELGASCSQSRRATNCATPRLCGKLVMVLNGARTRRVACRSTGLPAAPIPDIFFNGAPGGTRTPDPLVRSQML